MIRLMKDDLMKDERKFLFHRFIAHLFIIHLLTACGFHPVYKQSGESTVINEHLKNVEVPLLRGTRAEQIFSTELIDLLDPQSSASAKLYTVELKYKREEQPAVIEQDRTVTRYRLVLKAEYILREILTKKELTKGSVTVRTSYDELTNQFANYSAQTDSEQRAARELAELVRQRLVGYFGSKDQ